MPAEITEQPTLPQSIGVTAHITKLQLGDNLLFDNFDLELKANTTTCLLGPSGVGKSTLLRALAGLIPDLSKEAYHCSDGGALQGRTAYMAQSDALLPWLGALDNVLLGSRLRGEKRDYARAESLLGKVGLASEHSALPHTLSGGMRQRVALARTLMEDRPVVLMDEPFSSVDAVTRHELQNLAADVLRGRTVLLVTHDPMEALRLGDTVMVLSGRPARLHHIALPSTAPPRKISDPGFAQTQAALFEQLGMPPAESTCA